MVHRHAHWIHRHGGVHHYALDDFYAFKSKNTFATDKKLVYSALALWSVPFALFLVLSIKRSIGLHWVIGFVPFFMIWAAYRLHTEHLQKSIKWTIYLSIPHF